MIINYNRQEHVRRIVECLEYLLHQAEEKRLSSVGKVISSAIADISKDFDIMPQPDGDDSIIKAFYWFICYLAASKEEKEKFLKELACIEVQFDRELLN